MENEVCAGVWKGQSVEFVQEFGDGRVGLRIGHMMDLDGEPLMLRVGQEIGIVAEQIAQERAHIFDPADLITEKRTESGFDAVGNHFDRVQELLTQGEESFDFLRLG